MSSAVWVRRCTDCKSDRMSAPYPLSLRAFLFFFYIFFRESKTSSSHTQTRHHLIFFISPTNQRTPGGLSFLYTGEHSTPKSTITQRTKTCVFVCFGFWFGGERERDFIEIIRTSLYSRVFVLLLKKTKNKQTKNNETDTIRRRNSSLERK